MATVAVTFSNATAVEVRAANLALSKINTERAAHGLPTYAAVKDYIADLIINQLLAGWINNEREERLASNDVITKWQNASDAQRTNAITALTT